jgi:hypothetical protein
MVIWHRNRGSRLLLWALAVAVVVPSAASAQRQTLDGRVRGAGGAWVTGAAVIATGISDSVVVARGTTDALGRFRLADLEAGGYTLRVTRSGYAEWEGRVAVPHVGVLEVVLREEVIRLGSLEVAGRRDRAVAATRAGATVHSLGAEEIKRIPGLAESDVLRAVEILPGVVTTSDFSAAFNVRGGSADQNLILLDGLPVYNPFHLGGLFSVFNADMVSRTDLWTGGFPARFGGRVSSVLSIESDVGAEGFSAEGGVSLLATRLALGARAPAGVRSSLGLEDLRGRVSVRRSYFDQLLSPFLDFPYHLTDVQAYGEAWTRGGSRLSASGYTGRDVIDLRGIENFPLRLQWGWGNDVGGVRLLAPSGRGSVDVTLGATRFETDIRFPDFDDTEFRSRIDQLIVRADGEWPVGAHRLRAGFEAGRFSYDNLALTGGSRFAGGSQSGVQPSVYVQADLRRDERWLVEAGVRADGWLPSAGSSQVEVSPRLAVKRFLAGGDAALKLAAGRYTQFVHSLRDEELPLGIDIWVLAGERAPHVVSDQVQAGVELFGLEGWTAAADVYVRTFRGVITNNLADDPNDPLDDFVAGDGLSWGADLAVRRTVGGVRPSLAVSWLKAWRDFPDFRTGADGDRVRYPPVFDRRLDVDLLVLAPLPRGWDLGTRLSYGSGLPHTRPLASYAYFEHVTGTGRRTPPGEGDAAGVVLGPRNAERYPAYLRLDASVRRGFDRSWGRLTPYLEVVNVTNRRNVLFYFYELDRQTPVRSGISMFPLLPTFGVDISF